MVDSSFDVVSKVDKMEADNAVNQARKEVAQRYDFKGSPASIELDQKNHTLTLTAEDKFKIGALLEILQTRMVRRNVPIKNLKPAEIEPASAGTVKQVITLQIGIPVDTVIRFQDGTTQRIRTSLRVVDLAGQPNFAEAAE